MLTNKKTYIVAGVIALATFAQAMGWVTKEQYQTILGLLSSLGLAALRSGVSQEAARTKDIVQSAAGLKVVEMTPAEAVTEAADKKP